jgi:hypothetical protein
VTLVDIDTPTEVRRDRWGRYSVVPPDGGKPVGYQRATTLAKMLEDTSNLTSWACRMTLLGAANRPDIIASTLAANADDRQALNKLAEQAKEHGGANIRRDLGTAIHRFVELSHANPNYQVPEPYAADVAAINAAIDAAGFDVITMYSERILVVDGIQVAGMCDLGLRYRDTGKLHVGDLKTGSSVKYGALGWATQLSIYSMADAIYEQGAAKDGTDDRRLPAPDFDRDQAFIIHCEPQSGHADVYQLAIGERFVDLAVSVREVRKVKDLLVKFEGGGASSAAGTVEVVGSVEDNQPSDAAAPVTSPTGSVSSPVGDAIYVTMDMDEAIVEAIANGDGELTGDEIAAVEAAVVHEAATAWIINRTDAIIDALSKQHVGAAWPTDVARPLAIKNGDTAWTDADLDAIANALDALERKHALELPLSADPRALARKRAKAEAKAVEAATPPPRLTPAPDTDGPFATDAQLDALLAIVTEMKQSPDPATRERLGRVSVWQRNAETVAPWRTRQGPNGQTPLRVWAIGMAALACADLIDLDADDPDAAVRNLLAVHLGDDAHKPANTIGALFGVLTLDQAIALGDR